MSEARAIRASNGTKNRLKAQSVSKCGSVSRDPSHRLTIGETVAVVRLPTTMPPSIEGRAIIRDFAQASHCYWLEFIGDPCLRERMVHPDFQHDPERALQVLRCLWRAEAAAPDIDEFFPDPDSNP